MMASNTARRQLYPAIEPFQTQLLQVSDRHTLYFEQSGDPQGIPVLALHGGPGGGASPEMRRLFDPARYRIILFDQRGCGRSTPYADLTENTTWDLIADIEKLRARQGIQRWVVMGGSWGSTLALAYAAKHPEHVAGLILRGVFLLLRSEIQWFYQSGASNIFPDAFERYASVIPKEERGDLLAAFHKRLMSTDRNVRLKAARAWSCWEGETISLQGPDGLPSRFRDDQFVEAFARIESHYFHHQGFFPKDGWLLDQAKQFSHIPCRIIHGRYDVCTPLSSAWALSKVYPKAQLEIIPDAGHSATEPGIADALVRASDHFADTFAPAP